MIKNIILSLNKMFFIGLIFLVSLYANPTLSRTLIFQSGSESLSNQTPQVEQGIVANNITANDNVPKVAPSAVLNQTNVSSANSELFFMIEQLKNEVNSLRGMIEEQSNELRILKQSGKDRYLDLDTRVLDLTKRVSQSISDVNKVAATKTVERKQIDEPIDKALDKEEIKLREPTVAEKQAYDDAYALIKNKKFDESIMALFAYTENYPESPMMPNVYYWLGEVYLATSKLAQAKTSFSLVISAYPKNPKASDSLYKLAVTLDRLGETSSAKERLQEVQAKYPNSTAAKLASAYKLSE